MATRSTRLPRLPTTVCVKLHVKQSESVGRTGARVREKMSGGVYCGLGGLWANARGCPGSKYMHYILENGSTNGRNYSMTLKMGLGYKALERVNRAARARFATESSNSFQVTCAAPQCSFRSTIIPINHSRACDTARTRHMGSRETPSGRVAAARMFHIESERGAGSFLSFGTVQENINSRLSTFTASLLVLCSAITFS
jgi:hypothetical protein